MTSMATERILTSDTGIPGRDISALIKELYNGEYEKKISDADVRRICNQKSVYPFFRKENGRVIAMTILYVVELFTRKLGVIEEVVTLNEFRNQGIGSHLVMAALAKAKQLGLTCVELNVREDKPKVQKFYEGLGFYDRKNKAMRAWIKK